MTTAIDALVTPGEIARLLTEPQHRITHILNTRFHIRPVRRAGIVRLYGPEAVDEVREELRLIDARRNSASSA